MLKKLSLLFAMTLLFGCSSRMLSNGGIVQPPADIEIGNSQAFRVGVLLPLSGSAAKMGQGMKNAAQIALSDAKNPNLVLQFYDTQSNETGARIALENALSGQSKLIIGPLLSSNLRAISPRLKSSKTPTISFATNPEVIGGNIMTLGLMSDEQVDRIMRFSNQNLGKLKFALLLPDNATGKGVESSAQAASRRYGFELVNVTFYPPETSDFSKVLKEMTNHSGRSAKMNSYKASLQARASTGDVSAMKQLKSLGKNDVMGEVDFDAVLIAEGGPKLKSAISMFGYYDISAPNIQFMGTSVWEGTSLNNEEAAIGAIYPALSRNYSQYFTNKYLSFYEEKPNSLYALAYDAVALSSRLSKLKTSDEIMQALTKKDGYAGINGVFRLSVNGNCEHSLDIYQVNKSGDVVLDSAPKKFE